MLNTIVFKPKLIKLGSMESFNIKQMAQQSMIEDDLEEFYRIIECDTIDIVKRKIGGQYYCVICDDEALLKSDPLLSMVNIEDYKDDIFGNVIITGEENENGELTSLTEKDIQNIKNNVFTTITKYNHQTYMLALVHIL